MTLTYLIAVLIGAALAAAVALVAFRRWRARSRPVERSAAQRIVFPFLGDAVSRSALDATLRLARAEGATLVPAYITTLPRNVALDAPLPAETEVAMPLLKAIEQRAALVDVDVDARIERGRTPRHGLKEVLEHETLDRMVVPAATSDCQGFSPDDVAWLLEHAPGEVLVLRPARNGNVQARNGNGRARA